MYKRIVTIFQGNKYPIEYADSMAEFLQRFGVELWVYTDRPDNDFAFAIPKRMDFLPDGWWGKIMLFNPEITGLDDVLFCDVDSIFMKDPAPIFEWIEKTKPEGAFITDPIPYLSDHAGSSMFYLNHRHGKARYVYDRYQEDLDKGTVPQKTKLGYLYGDQDYITDMLPGSGMEWCYLPKHFQCQHKALYWKDNPRVYHIWKTGWKCYENRRLEDFISLHFIGTRTPYRFIKAHEDLLGLLEKLDHPFLRRVPKGC